MQKNRRKLIIAIYVATALYLLPMYPHGGSANELTRWATAASIVENGSFDIAWTEPLIGPNVDTAKIGSAAYSNKPPGVAILATPVYAVTRVFAGPPDASNIRVSWFVMKLFAATLPLFLLAMWLYRRGIDELGLAALLFATPLFGYSLLFFSHVLAAVLLYAAFRLLFDEDRTGARRIVIAGALCGLAVVSEFPAAFVVGVFGVALLLSTDRTRRVGYFVLGGLPFVLFLLIYNASLFGSPFSFSYAHESFPEWAEVASRGVLGIGFPTIDNFYLLLLSPARGLLWYSPLLILAVIAFFRNGESSSFRGRVKAAVVVVTILLLSGHGAAHGGWGFGPRYLVLIIPLVLDSFWRPETDGGSDLWSGMLLSISVVFCLLPMLTFPFAPPEFNVPQNDLWTRFLVDERWIVPTLADLAGARASVLTLLPIAAGAIFVFILIAASRRTPLRFSIGAFAGAVICAAVTFLPVLDSTEDRFRRATIAERYFKPAERIESFRDAAVESGDWNFVRRINEAEWNIADARAYAPDDFPYLPPTGAGSSPTSLMRSAIQLQSRGDTRGAERLITEGRDTFPFARCEFSSNLAVIYYTSGRKNEALVELESIQSMFDPGSRPDCSRSQYLLGTLYREMGRGQEATAVLAAFLRNTEGTTDPQLKAFRQQIAVPTR